MCKDSKVKSKEIVIKFGYLIGVRKKLFINSFVGEEDEVINKIAEIDKNENAKIIRYLSKCRNTIFLNWSDINTDMRYNMHRLSEFGYFDKKNLEFLKERNILDLDTCYIDSAKAVCEVSLAILKYVDYLKDLFPEWVDFKVMRKALITPGISSTKDWKFIKKSFSKFVSNKSNYPFFSWLNWEPRNVGNLLQNDETLLRELYRSQTRSDEFEDMFEKGLSCDLISCFINESDKTTIVVDCENADIFKFYEMIKSVNTEKISKIMLFDGTKTMNAWKVFGKYIDIQIEYLSGTRVSEYKSLVDIQLTAGVCKEHYENHVDSFILVSSDSDYWGLISTLKSARFLTVWEESKTSSQILELMDETGIVNTSIDKYCGQDSTALKEFIIVNGIFDRIAQWIGSGVEEHINHFIEENHLNLSEEEYELIMNDMSKSEIKISSEGEFIIINPLKLVEQ